MGFRLFPQNSGCCIIVRRFGLGIGRDTPHSLAPPPGGFGVLGSIDNTHAIIQPSITAVTNAASFVPGLAPGGIVTIFGTNLSNVSGIIAADKTPLPTELGGTQVIVSGFADSDGTTSAAALFSVANINGQEQINLQIPWQVVGLGCYTSAPDGCDVSIVVINNGISSDPVVINTPIFQPGIFTVDGSTGLITHADTNQLVTKDAPAASGEVVSIYSTGLGPIFPLDSHADGVPAPADSPIAGPIPYVTIDGQSSEVLKSILAPGFVGVNRVDVRIPAGVSSGSVDVIFYAAGWTKAAKMWVQ